MITKKEEKDKQSYPLKTNRAVALQYRDGEPFKVAACGSNNVAAQIVELAKKYNIPICQDSTLIDLLMALPEVQSVPEDGVELIAEVLSFLLFVEQKEI